MSLIRFFRGAKLLGQTTHVSGRTICELAIDCGVKIPTNCTSGTCGTCMITLLKGEIPVDEVLPPGLDLEYVEEGGRLGCIGIPIGEVDIEILPPL